ncbi:hypothetical protein AALB_3358 [Agarivorans albus MKT 106]|uniref:Uncharacterized protein n=1 Tax=Agarivorans albus MKT 106 TaxID=1331007 RepID=R9PPR2_AGAAL|nr:hypothetical protein AALB_3358 [Agarivorans albus MKT 106]
MTGFRVKAQLFWLIIFDLVKQSAVYVSHSDSLLNNNPL